MPSNIDAEAASLGAIIAGSRDARLLFELLTQKISLSPNMLTFSASLKNSVTAASAVTYSVLTTNS
jgi:hypothetical protein